MAARKYLVPNPCSVPARRLPASGGPTISNRTLYGSILRLIANGVSSRPEMSARLGRSRESLAFPLATLIKAGIVIRSIDTLRVNKPEHRLADPIIRFLRLVVDLARQLLDLNLVEWHWSRPRGVATPKGNRPQQPIASFTALRTARSLLRWSSPIYALRVS